MTQGHNIVADEWAGASKPYPHTPLKDGRTDKASYRVACVQQEKQKQTQKCRETERDSESKETKALLISAYFKRSQVKGIHFISYKFGREVTIWI